MGKDLQGSVRKVSVIFQYLTESDRNHEEICRNSPRVPLFRSPLGEDIPRAA